MPSSKRLAAAGYNVVAVARRESEDLTRAIQAAVGAKQGALHFRAFDLGEIDDIPAFVKALREEFGPLYGLVNNAGIGSEGLLATMHNSQIESLLRINVMSPIVLTKYVVRHMMADGAGRIINMSSIIGSTGYNGLSVYGATKAAATGFTPFAGARSWKARHHRQRDCAWFHRYRIDQRLAGEGRDRIAARSALRRLPAADDVASMVEYLLGEGGRNITGTVMTVDAGNTA